MKKIEFIESYRIPDDGGDYQWDDNHGRLIRCRDCKYFHYDKPYVVHGIPVLGHEVCDKWGDGCKTSENGFCFMAERRGEHDGND